MRSKSFKKWYQNFIEVPIEACNKRISSKNIDLDRWRKRFKEVKDSKLVQIDGLNRQDFLFSCEKNIRILTNEVAKQSKCLKELKNNQTEYSGFMKKLKNHPSIEKVVITESDLIKVSTIDLISKRTKIGKYSISFNPKDKDIRITNLTFKGSHQHWAVPNDSKKPCLGEYADIVMKYASEFDLYRLFDSIFHYLCESGDGNAYTKRDSWLKTLVPKAKGENTAEDDLEENLDTEPENFVDRLVAMVTPRMLPEPSELAQRELDELNRSLNRVVDSVALASNVPF